HGLRKQSQTPENLHALGCSWFDKYGPICPIRPIPPIIANQFNSVSARYLSWKYTHRKNPLWGPVANQKRKRSSGLQLLICPLNGASFRLRLTAPSPRRRNLLSSLKER